MGLKTLSGITVGKIIVIILLPLLNGCFPPPPPGGVDLTVQNIEITQAIQTTTNIITLVAQRSTAVRVTLGTGGGSVTGVTGLLHVFVNGAEITPVAGLPPINAPITAPASPQRSNENHTLNFELLAPSGITASADVDFLVDITPVPGETNTANNSGQINNLTFVNRTTPTLYFTRINWTPSGLGLPALTDVQAGRGDAFVRGIYPVNDSDPNLYRQGLFPTLTFTEDANGNSILDLNPEGNNLLSFLASCRQLIVDAGLGATDITFLYGWVAGNPIDANGWGQVSGRNAFGNTEHIRHQRTYAHELGHNFGLSHSDGGLIDEVGWDVGARLDGNPAGNNTTGRVRPITLNDIMSPGLLTNQAWVKTANYNFFLGSLALSSTSNGTSADQEDSSERILVIQGIFNPEGDSLLYLEPVFRFPWPSQPTSRRQGGRFAVAVTDETGNVTRTPFDALVADDAGPERHGFFEIMVAVPSDREVVSLRITDAEGARVFGGFDRSQPPEIIITAPATGAQLGDTTRVA
ncbi:MAG: hypothetical protein MN733_17380 [Nitrososphaera sp.]|nr:hypothetical protein [Nitrososphaera sp.]MCI0692304.1 hypothetical protein [candidate division KSB1 bacterium]